MEKIGVIDVGGGFRGVYATGVLDYCLDYGIHFDLGIGVSAGSANIASYAAGQYRRNLRFYTQYGLRREYASISNYIRKGSYIDLDYTYSTLSNSDGEYPLDYQMLRKNPMELIVVATEAETGRAKYFDKCDIGQDHYDIFKASSAIPCICPPYLIKGIPYFDGALSDPIPLETAFAWGCDRVILILTKPKQEIRKSGKDVVLAMGIRKKYPIAAQRICQRAELYNRQVQFAKRVAANGKVLIVAPDHTCGVDTLTRNAQSLLDLYEKGYRDGGQIEHFLQTDCE